MSAKAACFASDIHIHEISHTNGGFSPMETALSLLSGTLTPALLLSGGLWFGIRMRFFFIRHPGKYIRTLLQSASDAGTSPFAALSLALAGTLGHRCNAKAP